MARPTRLIGPEFPKNKLGDLHAGFQPYDQAGSSAVATIALESFQPCFWFSGAEACNHIMQNIELFRKDTTQYAMIEFHGPNIVSSEGQVWKRHRHAVRTSFSEKNYSLIWEESGRIIDQWFKALQKDERANTEVALNIIASVGFGQHFPWEVPVKDNVSSGLHFYTSIVDSVQRIIWNALIPGWARSLPIPQVTRTVLAFSEMERHIENLIREGKQAKDNQENEDSIASGSLLRGLLDSNDALENDLRLSEREILSNVFVFLLAGHETSAHTLSFVMAIFALYPDIHMRVREEADSIWPDPIARQSSNYKLDFPRLPYTLALFYETLRHFPAEPVLPRIADQDTVIRASKRSKESANSSGFDQEFSVVIPKGTVVVPDLYAMHMNTQHWGPTAPDFDPTRFLSTDWPKDAFAPFASGPRACIGRGFATAESVRIIASVAQIWDVQCKERMMRMPWTERKRVLLRWRQEVTMVPVDVKLSLSLRTW